MPIIEMIIVIVIITAVQRVLYKRLWQRGLGISVEFSAPAAVEGDELSLTETLVNRKLLPLPWVFVKFQVSRYLSFADSTNSQISDDYYRNDLFSIMTYQKITRTLRFTCLKRGYYHIKSVDLVSNDILFMGKLYLLKHGSGGSLTVYPKLINVDENVIPYKKISGDILAKRFINPDPFEFKGIREYQSYDSFKTINFKASAKAGRYMVNMYDYTVSQEIIILLNLQRYSSWVSQPLYEKSIRLAVSLADHFIGENIPVSLISGGLDIVTKKPVDIKSGQSVNHLVMINDALARIDLNTDALPIKSFSSAFSVDGYKSQVFILISTYHEPDLTAEYERLKQIGSHILWVVPAAFDTQLTAGIRQAFESDPQIIKWEVRENE